MNIRTRELKKFKFYDKTLSHIETPQGTLTLVSVFLPFLVEMLLTNSMGTVNTLVLSHYSDEAVASVGAANQLMGMIFTFYTVISTGASIFISHRLGARKRKRPPTPRLLLFSAAWRSVLWPAASFPCSHTDLWK